MHHDLAVHHELNVGRSIVRIVRWLVLITVGCWSGSVLADLPEMPESLGVIALPDKPSGAHWVWVADFQGGAYARSVLYDADTGDLLGMIDTGWEGNKLDLPHSGDKIYNFAMYMSRGFRGERTDVVTTYDKRTLEPLREVIVPSKGIHGLQDPNLSAISDDDRFLFMQFFTPASSIGVVDTQTNKYVGEIETSGCAHVMAAGPRRFFTLCGNGGALAVTIGDDGKEISRQRSATFFDPDKDPIHGSGVRSGNVWYFPSYYGRIYEVDVSGENLIFPASWSISELEKGLHWVPGPATQPVAVHHDKRRLYVLMHSSDLEPKGGGTDFHREDASELWVFDLDQKSRLSRIQLKYPTGSLAVSQDASPVIYGAALFQGIVTVYDEASGNPLRDIGIAVHPMIIQPVD